MKTVDFGLMPATMGCVTTEPDEDRFYPMRWAINANGLLAVCDPPPLGEVYVDQHSEPTVSQVWRDHHNDFGDFLLTGLEHRQILEVGGGSGYLAALTAAKAPEGLVWTILEPFTPDDIPHTPGVEWIEGWFPENSPPTKSSCIVATHVLEHSTDPLKFLVSCADQLEADGQLFLSWPNMTKMAERVDLNMLNFEHLHFLPLETVEGLLVSAGFEIETIQDFRGHSIFIRARKSSAPFQAGADSNVNNESLLDLAQNYRDSLDELVASMNKEQSNWSGEISIFGAHIFSQYLLARGLELRPGTRLVDNSTSKRGKRLCGTKLFVESPEVLREKTDQLILVAAALYEVEILEQLTSLGLSSSRIVTSRAGSFNLV